MKPFISALVVIIACLSSSHSGAERAVVPVPDRVLELPGTYSLAQIKSAVSFGGNSKRFFIETQEAGKAVILWPLNGENYQARFEIVYNEMRIKIRLMDSFGLNQQPCKKNQSVQCAHPNVSRRMNQLTSLIMRRLH